MDHDDDRPKPKTVHVIGENLDVISISELEQRIVILESEIGRIRSEIARKNMSRSAAAAFFKS